MRLRTAVMEGSLDELPALEQLSAADRAMLDFAVVLTTSPGRNHSADIEALRSHGFDDTAIHDIVQVTALFNYYNRLADGLGIDDEPDW